MLERLSGIVIEDIVDAVPIAHALINQTMSSAGRDEFDDRLAVADEVVGLAGRAGRADLASTAGRPRASGSGACP